MALSRYGGLRCPSEHLNLQIADVDWERDRMRVRSPKTEHHEGGSERWIPIFPELRPYLEELFDRAEPGAVHFITRYRDVNQNLRTQLLRIIARAGLEPWPKLFHNLRASRETELAAEFPIHVVCAWIGNTERIAAKHYLIQWRNVAAHHGNVPAGSLLTLPAVQAWRNSCDGLATSLDHVMYNHLRRVLRRKPW